MAHMQSIIDSQFYVILSVTSTNTFSITYTNFAAICAVLLPLFDPFSTLLPEWYL